MTDSSSTDIPNEKKPRILLADDSKLVRVTASKILAEKFDLVLVEDGEAAWEKICTDNTIQVVFTDLGMPKLDGYGLIQRIRQSEREDIRNQPIIVITGASEEEDVRRKVFELGATDFITKPFTATEILARAEAHASYRRDSEALQKSADIDVLTGTLNQAGLHKQLEKDVSFVNRHEENLAVIVFSLDNFRAIYERIGKQASARIIKQTAITLLGAIRKEDSVARFGSEKFAVILPMAKTEGVVILTKRLCEKIKSFNLTVSGESLPLTMSAGIATIRKGSQTTTAALLEAAEQALTNAKALGPGEVQILKAEPKQTHEAPLIVSVDALLEAIAKNKGAITENQMSAVIQQLSPLIAAMTEQQKQRLMNP
jgi:diguanylate cyclase (GGDEF)-like protein